jgi:hypothetical protein
MKKILFAALLVVSVNAVMAQTRFGAKLGPNWANWSVKVDGEKDDEYKSRLGFHAGFVADIGISSNFSIQPQLLYVNKGSAIEHEDHTDKAVINSIDIPVNFLYKAPSSGGTFFVGGGPNLGFNLSGTLKSEEHENEKIEIGSDPGQLKGFDFGLNFLAGYELSNGLFFSANYTPGLTNLQNVPSSAEIDLTARSNYFGISVGYFFGAKASAKK